MIPLGAQVWHSDPGTAGRGVTIAASGPLDESIDQSTQIGVVGNQDIEVHQELGVQGERTGGPSLLFRPL